MTYTLYGMAASLYTARVRSYMRVNAVPFTEIKAGSQEFLGEIVPANGRWIIPVIKTPDGTIIQDGANIIDHLDAEGFSKNPIYPEHPTLLAIAHLFELFGAQGLLKAAMHYRWNFDEMNLTFIRDTFRDVIPGGLPPEGAEQVFLQSSGRMRMATVALGVKPETTDLVEESYAQFLELMNAHLEEFPFMLGGHPTIADYGLIGAMYAHLGRDPAPLNLMQRTAPRVFRWVERMNMAETFQDEAQVKSAGKLFDGGDLPETLIKLMTYIAEDYLAEIIAHVAFVNDWLEQHPEVTEGTSTKDAIMQQPLGFAAFQWRGMDIQTVVLPYRFYLLNRLQDAVDRQSDDSRAPIETVFANSGLDDILTTRTKRRMERKDNQETWGALV
ncbi:MAG: glutathione S-transferase N-terminal domain-containing protein [Pseudomonadota bacterium]